jgi:2-oxo-4-hydroxy-4-carboxy-5-ureidoimidazoline decarboxylase
MTLSLHFLNNCPEADFQKALAGLVEHSDWVVKATATRRPFASRQALLQALMDTIEGETTARKVELLNAHPELAGEEARAGVMTEASGREQSRLGLTSMDKAQFLRLDELNRAYRTRFGFPCVIALRLHDSLETVFDTFRQRLNNSPEAELAASLHQVSAVVDGRLAALIPADD